MVFYGDSITETWRGTDGGHPCSRCAGVPEVFQEYFSSQHSTSVLAVGGEVHTRAKSCKQTTLPHQKLIVPCAIAVAARWPTSNSSDFLAQNQGSPEQHQLAQKQSDFQHAMGTLNPVLLVFEDRLCWFR